MSRVHTEIARALAGGPELLLSNPAEPETLDLAIACARTGYDVGSRYLHALQERGRAARRGAIIGAMRWTLNVSAARGMLLADAAPI